MPLDLDQVVVDTQNAFASVKSDASLENKRACFLDKSSVLTDLLRGSDKLDSKTRKIEGARINQAKGRAEEALMARRQASANALMNVCLTAEAIDVTLLGRDVAEGNLHPMTNAQEHVAKIFSSIGSDVADGPEIESGWMNFMTLSNPDNHPACSMQNTFYIDGRDSENKLLLLRTHTSPMQMRCARMRVEKYKHLDHIPPIKATAPGHTYRVDSDVTRPLMFCQVKDPWVVDNVSFTDLKGMYTDLLRSFFERNDIQVCFRPSYFLFAGPSAETDMTFGNGKQLETSDSGQAHSAVVRNVGLDPERYIGFAFDSGLERLTMLRYGINDLCLLFEDDVRSLCQSAQAPSAHTSTSSPC